MPTTDLPLRAAEETAAAHGVLTDRRDILQNGSTLVVRLSETLVARVVQDVEGPRQGTEWFARENAVALHLTRHGAPVIPLHPDLPPGPHERLGFTLNFWQYVTAVESPPEPFAAGRSLHRCHEILRAFPEPLPRLAILTESLDLLETLARRELFPPETLELLRHHLTASTAVLRDFPHQPLHGDAHPGNMLHTTGGLLWTDWEDTFSGPVEWDVASLIWNARILDGNHTAADQMLAGYREAGGGVDGEALRQCLMARAAVMSAWYPVLYPEPDAARQTKLRRRLEWLERLAPP